MTSEQKQDCGCGCGGALCETAARDCGCGCGGLSCGEARLQEIVFVGSVADLVDSSAVAKECD